MTTRRVFVMDHDPGRDVSDAERFGEVLYLYQHKERRPSVFSHALLKDVFSRMEEAEYDPDIDFVVVTGNMAMVTLVVTSLVARDGTVNLLLFDSAQEEYVQRTVCERSDHAGTSDRDVQGGARSQPGDDAGGGGARAGSP